MVNEESTPVQAVNLPSNFLEGMNAENIRPPTAQIFQLVGGFGSGARRLALRMVQPARQVVWISPRWNLYAPLLWKLASENGTQLLGIECADRKRWRLLWKELIESQVFDAWILDGMELKPGDGAFLEKLIRRTSIRILILEKYPHLFCRKRAYIHLSHHSYRLFWTRGASDSTGFEHFKPQYYPAPDLEFLGRSGGELCLP